MRFLDALLNAKNSGMQVVIPDIKRYSPKDGELLKDRSAVDYARALVLSGAPCLSVVTEEKEFHGSLQMLREIADSVDVPILRKDFIHTKEDLIETKEAGASAILLMCSCLEEEELKYLYYEALSLGLDPFVETHEEKDFKLVYELSARLIGINNRDILKLERDDGDVSHTESLSKLKPEGAFLVTESSIKNPDEVRRAIVSGADAALVGTAISLAPDPQVYYQMLTSRISLKVCGLMNKKDVNLCVSEGVERIGFVTEYPLFVPWNLDKETVKELRNEVPKGFSSCIVVGGSTEKIIELSSFIKPDYVQLHYKETLEDTRIISSELKKLGIKTIKTVPMNDESMKEMFGECDLKTVIESLCETDISELLVDPRHGEKVTSKNLSVDEELFRKVVSYSTKPVILAGGIRKENVSELLTRTGARYIDVMNGSELEPGVKDQNLVHELVRACK